MNNILLKTKPERLKTLQHLQEASPQRSLQAPRFLPLS